MEKTQEGVVRPTRLPGKDKLFYAANRWLAALGKQTGIKFSHFNKNLF
ncbi:hypothetical protein [Bacteroides nordii]|nr:hypothetical protein [Bacteroides nordii]MCG4771205.1 hypothetical protein [Bacteroides nordii]